MRNYPVTGMNVELVAYALYGARSSEYYLTPDFWIFADGSVLTTSWCALNFLAYDAGPNT